MAIDSSSFKVVFCEGKPNSLDYLLLTRILPVGQVRIRPVGGKFGLRAYIQGYLGNYPVNGQPQHVAFRDRDFDLEPSETPQLIRLIGETPIWLSYRAAIENYLIDPDLLRRYWGERENTPNWKYGLTPSVDEIESHIQESARELIDYQAVRWGLAKLKPDLRWPEVRTTWTDGSGNIPQLLDYDNCLAQATELVKSFQTQIQDIHPDNLQKHAESYRQQFAKPSFFQEHKYLVWFHGKDHLAQLCRRLAPNFPRRHYAEWAAEHIDITKHPDLQHLVELTS